MIYCILSARYKIQSPLGRGAQKSEAYYYFLYNVTTDTCSVAVSGSVKPTRVHEQEIGATSLRTAMHSMSRIYTVLAASILSVEGLRAPPLFTVDLALAPLDRWHGALDLVRPGLRSKRIC